MNRSHLATLALILAVLGSGRATASAASTDRTVLYALTNDGTLLNISTATGASTVVRHLPFTPGISAPYSNLVVYHGTFLTQQNGPFIAFGIAPNDQVRLRGGGSSQSGNLTEYPSTGLPRSWEAYSTPGGAVANVIRETDPVAGISTQLLSTGVIFPQTYYTCGGFQPNTTCTNDVIVSSFGGNNTSYFIHTCADCGGYSGRFQVLIRADLQNGHWVKTKDVALPLGTFAADPVSDGILWASSTIDSFGDLTKINVNTSPFTFTRFYPTLIGNTAPIIGMAFGPPTADVLSPKNVPQLSSLASKKPWTPIEMLLKRHP